AEVGFPHLEQVGVCRAVRHCDGRYEYGCRSKCQREQDKTSHKPSPGRETLPAEVYDPSGNGTKGSATPAVIVAFKAFTGSRYEARVKVNTERRRENGKAPDEKTLSGLLRAHLGFVRLLPRLSEDPSSVAPPTARGVATDVLK